MAPYALQARWLFPISGPPLENGVITVENQRIVAVGENSSGHPPRRLGEVAILPGLINAHTHLEFSELQQPLDADQPTQAPGNFADWIRRVIAYRGERMAAEPHGKPHSLASGLAESHVAGVTAVGEIATLPHAMEAYQEAADSLCGTLFLELLGLSPEREAALLAAASEHLSGAGEGERWHRGLSPHAPYTASPRLVAAAVSLAREHGARVAMHLAESREEMELLASGGGPLVQLLEELGAWRPGLIPLGSEPLDYLRLLAEAPHALVIHGNYLIEEELEFLANHREGMTLVYCPRTHARFGHPRYPLLAALAAGVRVALGTDSRASNPNLSLFEELQFVSQQFPQVDPAELLPLATFNGAEALGLEAELGSLEVGKRASLAVVQLGAAEGDPYARLLAADARVLRPSKDIAQEG